MERSIASRLASQPKIVSLNPNSLADIWDDIRMVARSLEIIERGEDLIATLQRRMCAISEKARSSSGRARSTSVTSAKNVWPNLRTFIALEYSSAT